MRILGILLAMAFGFVVWIILLMFTTMSNPLGKVGPVEQMMVWAPIIGTAVPIALDRFNKDDVVTGAWILAIAPFLSVLNFFMYMALVQKLGMPNSEKGLMVIWMAWQLPWLYVLVQWLRNFRRALKEEKSPDQ